MTSQTQSLARNVFGMLRGFHFLGRIVCVAAKTVRYNQGCQG